VPSKLTALFVAVFVTVLLVAGCAACRALRSADVPEKLKPGANESLAMVTAAKGVQIYECRASNDRAGEYDWIFVAPEAELFDATGTKRSAGTTPARTGNRPTAAGSSRHEGARRRAYGRLDSLAAALGEVGRAGRPRSAKSPASSAVHTVGGVAPKGGCFESESGMQLRIGYTRTITSFRPARRRLHFARLRRCLRILA